MHFELQFSFPSSSKSRKNQTEMFINLLNSICSTFDIAPRWTSVFCCCFSVLLNLHKVGLEVCLSWGPSVCWGYSSSSVSCLPCVINSWLCWKPWTALLRSSHFSFSSFSFSGSTRLYFLFFSLKCARCYQIIHRRCYYMDCSYSLVLGVFGFAPAYWSGVGVGCGKGRTSWVQASVWADEGGTLLEFQ